MLRKSRLKTNEDIPDSSMADIAFLLLIFFMVTTGFFNDKGLSIMLPGEAQGSAKIPKQNLCKIFINSLGNIYVDDQLMQETATISGYVESRMKENDKLVVIIKTDENARYDWMLRIFDEMKKIGMKKISLQVNKKR